MGRVFVQKRIFIWLSISLCLSFITVMGGCECGGTQPTEIPLTETTKDGGVLDRIVDATPDTVVDQAPGSCQQRCDCPQGQECSEGKCIIPTEPVYCCDKDNCPQGLACNNNSGDPGTCGLRKRCNTNCDCDQGLACENGYCTRKAQPVYCCERAGCPAGATCNSQRGGTQTCGSEGSACTTACDCVNGLGCVNGQCTKQSAPVYCCDSQNCPKGQACETRKGGQSTCGGQATCKTACDCTPGEACNNGKCERQAIPVYCCDKPTECPENQVCDKADGTRGQCPSKPQCTNACDCPQGQDCTNGRCVVGRTPVYCCDKPGCPAKAACNKKDGSASQCPGTRCTRDSDCGRASCQQVGTQCTQAVPRCRPDGNCANEITTTAGSCNPRTGLCVATPQCRTDCDCPQGQPCTNGKCIPNPPRLVYCCSKQGCPAKASCTQADGSSGTCPAQPGCNSDKDCGSASCVNVGSDCVEKTPTCDRKSRVCVGNSRLVKNAQCDQATNKCKATAPACKVDCDCPQGLACRSGQCLQLAAPVYCCEKAGCPSKKACTNKDGSSGTCPTTTPTCKTSKDCGGFTCSVTNNVCKQVIYFCDTKTGKCGVTARYTKDYTCNTKNGLCEKKVAVQCKVDCNCAQGQTCINGQCVTGTKPSYCCDTKGCPPGNACTNKSGKAGTCPKSPICKNDGDCGKPSCRQSGSACVQTVPRCDTRTGTCQSAGSSVVGTCDQATGLCKQSFCTVNCDCPQGQYCQRGFPGGQGTCRTASVPIYCCDKAGCPNGQRCYNKQNQLRICPLVCKGPCDCAAGEDCNNGKCIRGRTPVYCCDKQSQCPAGATCKDSNGKASTCPQKPRTCKSPCDCIQGEACTNGVCTKSATPVYCCSNAGCPAGKACKDKQNLSGVCRTPCKEQCDCPQGQRCSNGFCDNTTTFPVYCCDKPGCASGQFCSRKGGGGGRCPVTTCKSACDCAQGQDCRNGQCTRVFPAVYCCSKASCPASQACKDSNNKWGTCPSTGGCKSPCDCPQGQDCYKGQCIRVFPAVYCCSKTGCPAQAACFDKNNTAGKCPGIQCTNACDCRNQGESCIAGRCLIDRNNPTYCCDKPGCRAGFACEDKNGKASKCPGSTCKNSCDCRQGQACVRGTCKFIGRSVLCCSKPGCRAGAACEKADGSAGVCPGTRTCKVACDCNQGEDCQNGVCTRVSPPVYCCSKSGCRSGQLCQDTSGKSSACPGTQSCKSSCDCPQRQGCVNGFCIQTSVPVYCCSNAGCPARQICEKKDGTRSTCAVQCRGTCDCPQGQQCFSGTCFNSGRRLYCCDKTGCPQGRTCQDKNGRTSTCGSSPGGTCKQRCDCPQGEECVAGKCTRQATPTYCCDNAGCPRGFLCRDKSGRNGTCR